MADYYDIPNDAPKDLKVSELSLHETIPDDPDAAWLLIVVRGRTGRARTLGPAAIDGAARLLRELRRLAPLDGAGPRQGGRAPGGPAHRRRAGQGHHRGREGLPESAAARHRPRASLAPGRPGGAAPPGALGPRADAGAGGRWGAGRARASLAASSRRDRPGLRRLPLLPGSRGTTDGGESAV